MTQLKPSSFFMFLYLASVDLISVCPQTYNVYSSTECATKTSCINKFYSFQSLVEFFVGTVHVLARYPYHSAALPL